MLYHIMVIDIPDTLFFQLKEQTANMNVEIITAVSIHDAAKLCEGQEFQLICINQSYLEMRSDIITAMRRITFAPIVILADRYREEEICLMFNAGADLCLPLYFPFSLVCAQIMAQLRRYTEYNYHAELNSSMAAFQRGDVFIDPLHHLVKVSDQNITLRPREFKLLLYFMQNPNIVLTTEQICECAWGNEQSYGRGISQPISILRNAIEPDPSRPVYIETVYGVGYRFIV
ncbi:MAG: response regulator transcription factor [Lachnospiraceae bacterium]|nr:response regulator transcription factor [Lachnospiraceae bacterium]